VSGNVFVTGASGFVGSAVVAALLDRGHGVTALVHRRPIADGRVRNVTGDLFDAAALVEELRGATAIVHLVGVIAERPSKGITFDRVHDQGTAALVRAAVAAGVRRFVYLSAQGARPDAPAAYHRTKFAAEQHVRSADLDWTILRPSLVHGPAGEFTRMLAGWARGRSPPYLFMPYFGAGPLGLGHRYQVQPIHVDDVARAVVDALERPTTIGQTIPLGGPDRMTWPQMYRTAAEAIVGRRRPVVAIPAWYAKLLTHVVPRPLLPFGRSEVLMSQEDNVCDPAAMTAAFGWPPRPFGETVRAYAPTIP
jgi:nucleoside-diphosphate-sugar epimerase